MEIKYCANGEKSYLVLALLEVLKEHTDFSHKLTKKRIREMLEKNYNIPMSRNTLDNAFKALEAAGYQIDSDSDGWYLIADEDGFEDGELRILMDSVLYSNIFPKNQAEDLIRKLAGFGSVTARETMPDLAYRAAHVSRSRNQSAVLNIEKIQQAIASDRKIECDYEKYNSELQLFRVNDHRWIINPYDLAFSKGRYYLIGNNDNHSNFNILRVDRMTNVNVLDSRRKPIDKISEYKHGMTLTSYISTQPILCGGEIENFKIKCDKDFISDLVDEFEVELYNNETTSIRDSDLDTVTVMVRTTREAIRYWAIMHAEHMAIVSPQDFKEEIMEALARARHNYDKTERTPRFNMYTAFSLKEAITEVRKNDSRIIRYRARTRGKKLDKIDITLFKDCEDILALSLHDCEIEGDFTKYFPHLRDLSLVDCTFDKSLLKNFENLRSLNVSNFSDEDTEYILHMEKLRDIGLYNSPVHSVDFLEAFPRLTRLRFFGLSDLTDISGLKHNQNIWRIILADCDGVTDFSPLENLTELKSLDIRNPNFTEEFKNKLQEIIPECRIRTDRRYL